MKAVNLAEKDQESTEEAKVIPFKLLPGGKDGDDWLSTLPVGTMFLAKVKNKVIGQGQGNFVLGQYEVAKKLDSGKAVMVFNAITKDLNWVEPRGFSSTMDLIEIIGYVEKAEQEELEEASQEVPPWELSDQ